MAKEPRKKAEPRCPCCKALLPPYGTMPWHKDEFAETFRIWVNYHRLIFDMNGREKEGAFLTASWQELFRLQMNPLPSAEELKAASQWMIGDENLARAQWASHFAFLKGRINRGRAAKATDDAAKDGRATKDTFSKDAERIEQAKAKVFKSV